MSDKINNGGPAANMSLRDHFAGLAMQALIPVMANEQNLRHGFVAWMNKIDGSEDTWADHLADEAYLISDAILERKKWDEGGSDAWLKQIENKQVQP
mgnify:CR=1 FL=1